MCLCGLGWLNNAVTIKYGGSYVVSGMVCLQTLSRQTAVNSYGTKQANGCSSVLVVAFSVVSCVLATYMTIVSTDILLLDLHNGDIVLVRQVTKVI